MVGTRAAANPTTMQRHARVSYLAAIVGASWATVHGLGLLGPLEDYTFLLLGSAAIVATVLGIRWYRPSRRWPWLSILTAMVLFLVGGVFRIEMHTLGNLTASRSLVPDIFTIPGYVFLGAGFISLARARRHRWSGEVDAILDGVVAALAALAIAWVFLIGPVLYHEHAPQGVRLLLATYPTLSVFVLAVTARMAFSASTRRAPGYRLLLAAIACMLVGDIVYMLADAHLATLPGSLIDLPYALAYVAFIAVVLHPSMRELSEPAGSDDGAPTRPRLAFVAVALAVPALVTVTRQDTGMGDRIALTLIVLALTATAIWRVLRALRAHALSQARLAHQVTHDALTGLPNRLLTEEHTRRALERAEVHDSQVALLFLDLDHFKLVNDTLGHSTGDDLLIAVSHRLTEFCGPDDFVARIGGDEFVVVVSDVDDTSTALVAAEKLRSVFQKPFTIHASEIYSSASIGVAIGGSRRPSGDAEVLVRDADTAMYQAKAAGRDRVSVFDASMRDTVAERLELERDLRQALERGELHLNYQPIVRLPDGRIEGVEALLRWTHPTRGSISPAKFIPIAEDSGLIVEIGSWVLLEASRTLAKWRRDVPGAEHLHMAVNLSARQLRDPVLVDTVKGAIANNGLPPDALVLELTESLLMENPTAAADILSTLRDVGVKLSIDDFGTGYSSLAYLKRFPVDHVKIDRAFVEGLDHDDSSEESLVAAIIAMAGALHLDAVAEGVETHRQQQRLERLGCTLAQGFLFARPVPPDQLTDVVMRHNVVAPALEGLDGRSDVEIPAIK